MIHDFLRNILFRYITSGMEFVNANKQRLQKHSVELRQRQALPTCRVKLLPACCPGVGVALKSELELPLEQLDRRALHELLRQPVVEVHEAKE